MAAALAAVLVVTYATYRLDIHRAYARVSAGSQLVQTRCGPIEYATAGDGPPVLVVHGAGGGFDQGLDIGESLARGGFRVIAMSRFGYLRTPVPKDATAAAQADAHACLMDALGIQRAAVIGVSAGGPSAMELAVRYPDRLTRLVLMVPAAYSPRPMDAEASRRMPPGMTFLLDTAMRSDFLFWTASKVARRTFIRAILGTPPEVVAGASAAEQARVKVILEHVLPVQPRASGLLNDLEVVTSLGRYDLEKITAPTLAISSRDDLYDTFEGARYTASQIPHARFIGYPSGGHMLVGRDANAEIAGFLRAGTP